jgi:SSS family solute:Na+ symporter
LTGIVALLLLVATLIAATTYARLRSRSRSVEEWAIGGRRFGTTIFWFTNAGEIYTTFAVLGVSGFAWAYGAPAYVAFSSVTLACAVGYWLTPQVWRASRDRGLLTQADFFSNHYGSRWLGVLVAVAGISAMVVYVQIQITALSLVVGATTGIQFSPLAGALVAAAVMLAFVYFSGLRSAAFAAGVKDVMMVLIVVLLSVTVASKVGASSILDVFRKVQEVHPGIGSLPGRGGAEGLSTTWFITSSLNVAFSTWVFPHMFQICYAAQDAQTLRRNAVLQPLYSLSYFFIILLGFAALLANSQPAGGDSNAALMQFVSDQYPPWAVGLFVGTIALLALVPGSVLLLTSGTIFVRNIVQPVVPAISKETLLRLSQISMVGFAAIAVYLTAGGSKSLVRIGLSAYASIGMLAPGIFLAFLWARTSALAVALGILVGYIALLHPAALATWARWFPQWEPGLIAMIVNLLVALIASLVFGKRRQPLDA